jgi:hypothetical protein
MTELLAGMIATLQGPSTGPGADVLCLEPFVHNAIV